MDSESPIPDAIASDAADAERTPAWADPDMVRLIELVERIGGHGEQSI